jgi:hypothetical protein
MTLALYAYSRKHDNPRNCTPTLARLSAEHHRLLGCNPPALIWQPERGRSWLAAGVVPPTIRVEAGREIETLASNVVGQLRDLDLPTLVLFEAGPAALRHWVGVPVFVSSPS